MSNVEIAAVKKDERPAVWAQDVEGLDVFRMRAMGCGGGFALRDVKEFRSFGARGMKDVVVDAVGDEGLKV